MAKTKSEPRSWPETRGQRIVKQIYHELKDYFAEDDSISIDGVELKYSVREIRGERLFHLQVDDPDLKGRQRHITIEIRESF